MLFIQQNNDLYAIHPDGTIYYWYFYQNLRCHRVIKMENSIVVPFVGY